MLHQKGYITSAENVTPSEVSEITEIDVSDANLSSLHGIEKFSNLNKLDCHDNQLEQLDISKNTHLTKLWCDYNRLNQLDISQNNKLTRFSCQMNPGEKGVFEVKSWFDNTSIPETITNDMSYRQSWTYDGMNVAIYYYK